MEALGLFLLKSVIWLTGFALVYFLFLRNERFFMLNRYFLLSGIIISLIFPFISIHYIINLPLVPEFQTGDLTVTGIRQAESFSVLDLQFLLSLVYVSGVAVIAFGLLKQCRSVIRTIKKGSVISSEQVKLIRTPDYSGSFSFFSYVFVNPSVSDRETREIVNHELAHIRQKHWLDLVLCQLLCMVQWFNPVVWIYVRFIRQNHEYLADEVALQRTSDPAVYKATLLNQIVGVPVVSLANSFNYSINKKRFTMMKNIINSPYRRMKILLILPVFALVLYAFAKPEYRYIPVDQNTADKTVYPDLQAKEVKGIIKEQGGKPLQGAAVVIKGTTIGTTTDSKGSFKLGDVPEDGSLIVSYVGFKSKVVKPVFTSDMSIQMVRDTVTLGVFGAPPPPPPPPPAGYVKDNNSGIPPPPPPPPAGIKVGMEGINPPPMIIINGLVSDLKAEQIDPNTIESITVLKDESAKALYGEKGKNGVLLVTLKQGARTLDLNTPITVTGYKTGYDGVGGVEVKNYKEKIQGNPLYVIDGVVSDKKTLEGISANDIESVSVWKGIKATDKYGEKAKDGVVEIKTKKSGYSTKSDLEEVTVTGYSSKQPMVVMEEMPMFPGGDDAMQLWISENLKYPGDAIKDNKTGKVIVTFVVSSTGKVKNVKVNKSVSPSINAEAIRVISSMPDWKPGSQNGKPVDIDYMLSVNFDFNQKVPLNTK
jgi:TonB family protein